MITLSVRITLRAGCSFSLKDKRMIVRSVLSRTRAKFNVSIAEVDALDSHKTIVLGACTVSNSVRVARSILDGVVRYIEATSGADVVSAEFCDY